MTGSEPMSSRPLSAAGCIHADLAWWSGGAQRGPLSRGAAAQRGLEASALVCPSPSPITPTQPHSSSAQPPGELLASVALRRPISCQQAWTSSPCKVRPPISQPARPSSRVSKGGHMSLPFTRPGLVLFRGFVRAEHKLTLHLSRWVQLEPLDGPSTPPPAHL